MEFVRHLDVHLTHRCSLRCSYCYASAPGAQLPADLTPELADAAVEFLFAHAGEAPRLRLDLWGGEPFVRLDLIERIAERATHLADVRAKSIRIGVPTNVTLLDARALDAVRRWNLQLSLSLDGTPDAHAQRRTHDGRNGWELIEPRLMDLLRSWQGALPPVRMTIVPARADRLESDLAFLRNLGFRRIAFLPASGVSWSRHATDQLDNSLRAVALDLARHVRRGAPDTPSYPHLLRRLAPLWIASKGGALPRRRGLCGAGETLLAVDTTGALYPCHRVVGMPMPPADLRLGSLAEGVTNRALRARIASLSADDPEVRCSSCDHRATCGTLCIAVNHRVTGDVASIPDEACFVADRLRIAARRLHDALVGHIGYDRMMQSYVESDLDDRFLPLLSSLESEPEAEALVADVELALAAMHKR